MMSGWIRSFELWARATSRDRSASRRRKMTNRRPRSWRPDSPEPLEGRALLTITPGYDYLLSGYQWTNPSHITYSIAPDGVMWENGVNNLNAVFNARFGPTAWKRQIAQALATWEAVANINITQVPDGPYAFNTPGLTQGDPRFGDIRFGGDAFLNNQTTLAQSYFPPPDDGTGSGDDEINTAMPWAIGSNDDLFSVMLHETGLTLGLGEVSNPNAVMNRVYSGVRSGLTAGDIAGIQAIYGARTPDHFQSQGLGTSFVNAADLSADFNREGTAIITGTSLATIGDTEYFNFVAPANASGNLSVTVGTTNVSMLSPELTLYKAPGQPIETEANPAAWGDNLTAQVTGVTPGQRYYVTVTGATNDVFSVGAFDMNLTFSTATPATPAPSAPVATPVASTPPSTPTAPRFRSASDRLADRLQYVVDHGPAARADQADHPRRTLARQCQRPRVLRLPGDPTERVLGHRVECQHYHLECIRQADHLGPLDRGRAGRPRQHDALYRDLGTQCLSPRELRACRELVTRVNPSRSQDRVRRTRALKS